MNNIFLAAATRSGSTHIKNCFVLLGWRAATTHICLDEHFNEEHMVDAKIATALFPMGGFVFQQHTRAIGRNVEILREYGVKPVVTYRNVLDSLVSLKDSTGKDPRKGYTFLPLHLPDLDQMSEDDKLWWLAYNMIPWWYSFYVSWRQADIDKLFIRYDEFYDNQTAGLAQILEFTGNPIPEDGKLDLVSLHKGGKFNVGISGRGWDLPPGIIDLAYSQAKAWGPWREEIECNLLAH